MENNDNSSELMFEEVEGRLDPRKVYASDRNKYMSGRAAALITLGISLGLGSIGVRGLCEYSRNNLANVEQSIVELKADMQQGFPPVVTDDLSQDIQERLDYLRNPPVDEVPVLISGKKLRELESKYLDALNTTKTNKNYTIRSKR